MKLNFKDKSILILIAVNLFPLIGVIFFAWDAMMIVILYCIETFIIGLFNAAKMILSKAEIPKKYLPHLSSSQLTDLQNKRGCLKSAWTPFFLVHYSGFVIIQAIMIYFISDLFYERELSIHNFLSYDFIINVLLIIFSHAYYFYKNYLGKKEYEKQSVVYLMFLPYKRILIQVVVVFAGTFFIILFHGPIGFLILLIGLKIYFDMRVHNKPQGETDSILDIIIESQRKRNSK